MLAPGAWELHEALPTVPLTISVLASASLAESLPQTPGPGWGCPCGDGEACLLAGSREEQGPHTGAGAESALPMAASRQGSSSPSAPGAEPHS